jgi:hypothetical protein
VAGYEWRYLARALSLDLITPPFWLLLGIDPDILPGLRAASRKCVEELEPLRQAEMQEDPDLYIGPRLKRSQFEAALRDVGADDSEHTLGCLEALAWEASLAPFETLDEDRWWLVFLRLESPLKKTPPCPLPAERRAVLAEIVDEHLHHYSELPDYDSPKELKNLSRWDRNLLAGELHDAGFCPTLNISSILVTLGTRWTWREVSRVLTDAEMQLLIEWGRLVEAAEGYGRSSRYTPLDRPRWDSRPRIPDAVQAEADQSEWRIDLGPGPYGNPEEAFKIPSLEGIRTQISRRDIWVMYLKDAVRWMKNHRPFNG